MAISRADLDAINGLNSAQTEFENYRTTGRAQSGSLLRRAFHSAVVFTGAGLYIFDLLSNILVLQVYWQEVYIKGNFEGSSPGSLGPEITAFAACLTFLVSTQIVALIVFRLHLPPDEYPIRSALILPLVQVYRVVREICRSTTGCGRLSRGSERWESSEAESLFAIMSALETSLQIPLQITYIVLTGIVDDFWHPSPVLVLSVVVSFLSGAYNAGLGIMYQSSLKWGLMLNAVGIAGGLYTVGSLLVRSMAVASVSAASEVSGIHHSKLLLVYFAIMGLCLYCFGLISVGKTAKLFTCEAQLRAWIAIFYYDLGPVFPMLEGFYKKSHSTRFNTLGRLLVVATLNLLLDVLTFIIIAELKWGFCNFSRERIPFPHLPYLSSALTCSRFIQLTSFGAALSVVSMLALCYILFRSSVKDIHANLMRNSTSEFLNSIRAELNVRMSDNLAEADDAFGPRSISVRHQPMCDKKMPLDIVLVNMNRFSSRIASFESSRLEEMAPPSGNLIIDQVRKKCIHSPSRRLTTSEIGEDLGPDPTFTGVEDGEIVYSSARVFEQTESIRSGQNKDASVELRDYQSRTGHGLAEDRAAKSASSRGAKTFELDNGLNFLPRGSNSLEVQSEFEPEKHELERWTLTTKSGDGQPEGVADDETSHLRGHGTDDSTTMILRDHGRIMRAVFRRSSSAGGPDDENRVKKGTGNKVSRSLGETTSFTL